MSSAVYKQSFKIETADTPQLSVYNCGLQSCEAGYTWGPGVRDHYLIHLVTSGCGSYQIGSDAFSVSAGDLFLAKPGQLITYTADTEDPWEYYWVGFNGAGAAALVQQLPFTEEAPLFRAANPATTRDILHNIYLSVGQEPYNQAAMTGHLYLFLSHLMQHTPPLVHRPPQPGSSYVVAAIKFIQFNYSRDISINDIAAAVGVSRSHLYRVFVSHLGQSPVEYLTLFRISEACSLLETTNLTVAEVAYSVGFFDQFYFSRVFKRIKGVPPSQYATQSSN